MYLAHDPRLDRQVAIKALPVHLAQDADRLARFQREARLLASLNHPGIGAIYGLEESAGHQYLILEFIDGQTLADRLAKGPIAIDDSLQIARQIAEALEVAHDKAIIHRDLKPGNVMVTSDGVVKVLDFGLARTADGSPSSSHAVLMAASPTLTSPVQQSPTVPGVVMGTAGYMSPEQARGKAVDKRSDIFSFGCVLYEMITGATPFPGETPTDSIGAILHREPNWALLPPSTPPRVRDLLARCLAKDRRHRLHDIADARIELEQAISGHEWSVQAATPTTGSRPRSVALAALGGAILLVTGWLAGRLLDRPAPPLATHAFHLSADVPAEPRFSSLAGIASDARYVVYTAWTQLDPDSQKPGGVAMVRRLDRDETKPIDGTEGAVSAALSPDGRWLAFVAAKDRARTKQSLKKVALEDGRAAGVPEPVCDLPTGDVTGLCWSSDREIVVALGWRHTILAVSAGGGEPRVVLEDDQSKEFDMWGELRPLVPGKSILGSRWALVGESIRERTEVVDLATGKRTPLLANAGGAQLVGGDYVVARRNQNSLIAVRLDLATLQTVGDPVTVWSGNFRDAFFVSASGALVLARDAGGAAQRRLMWLDEHGALQPVGAPPRAYGRIAVSPDGGRVAVTLDPADLSELPTDIWIYDLTRRTFSRLTSPAPTLAAIWSGDGKQIGYNTVAKDTWSLWARNADGSGEPAKLYAGSGPEMLLLPVDWSPDGTSVAAVEADLSKGIGKVLILERDAGSSTWNSTPYLANAVGDAPLRFSRDGKWVRYLTDESGRRELFLAPFAANGANRAAGQEGRKQISTAGAIDCGWSSPDGKEIRYIDADLQVVSVQVETSPTFTVSLPKVVGSLKELETHDRSFAPDGRLMVVLEGEGERISKVDVVLGFFDQVRAKVAAAK